MRWSSTCEVNIDPLKQSFNRHIIHNGDVETPPLSRTDGECFIDTNEVTAICEWSTGSSQCSCVQCRKYERTTTIRIISGAIGCFEYCSNSSSSSNHTDLYCSCVFIKCSVSYLSIQCRCCVVGIVGHGLLQHCSKH